MIPPEDKKPGLSIVARVEERWLAPLKRNAFATRQQNLVAAAAVCAIYAGAIGYVFYRDAHTPIETTRLEEIPVEVVPPPPPPPKPQPEAKKEEAKQELEKPAASAPRAPSEDKVETERMDAATRAPKAETPPQEGEKAPPPEPPAAAADANDHDDKAQATKEDVLEKDAEALAKATPMPPEKPETLAKAPPKAKVRREKTAVARLSGKSDLPDTKLARPTKRAPITGGNEDNRYLSNVFAKIMANYEPAGPDDAGTVTVAFNVDDDGTVLRMQVIQSSGDAEADEAAVAAVSRASPLPPLPAGAPHGLVARIGAHPARTTHMGRGEE